MKNGKKIIAVLPAFNAAKTLADTLGDIPRSYVDDVILVDDASTDGTPELARSLGLTTIVHPRNRGYGGNQKTCYDAALERGADIVIMVHPDHQYDPTLVPQLIGPIARGEADAVFGSRMLRRGEALKGGMPYWKYLSNIALTRIENAVLGLRLSEYHSGFRAYRSSALRTLRYHDNSDDFVFDTEIIVQCKLRGLTIKEVPIPTRYFKDASSVGIKRSVVYGVSILAVMAQFLLHKLRFRSYTKFELV